MRCIRMHSCTTATNKQVSIRQVMISLGKHQEGTTPAYGAGQACKAGPVLNARAHQLLGKFCDPIKSSSMPRHAESGESAALRVPQG